jgi:hypothetical protein
MFFQSKGGQVDDISPGLFPNRTDKTEQPAFGRASLIKHRIRLTTDGSGPAPAAACFCQQSCTGTHKPFADRLGTAAHGQYRVTETESRWALEPMTFNTWPLRERVC